MLPAITIRDCTPDDTAGLHAALDSVARERKFLGLVEAPTLDEVASFGRLPTVVRIVAVCEDQVVGWADVAQMRRVGFTHRGVLGMGIVSQHRRRGIGSRLLAQVLDRSRVLGVTRIELQVFYSNAAAVSLYQKDGFQIEGQMRGARILDGVVDDILLMARDL